MKVVILCGGRGIRAFPFTEYLPKPMLPIGGTPIIVHVVKNFINQGFNDFILAAGYRRSVLEDYFEGKDLGARITILDTGDEADTGERIFACREHLTDTFIATYADGLSDVPLHKLVKFHRGNPGLITITAVPMYSQYGILDVDDDGLVLQMREKPLIKEHWINAGFMVIDPAAFDHWHGTNLEQQVLPTLAARQRVYTYRHNGFFKSLDSYKDQREFDRLADQQPWLVTEDTAADAISRAS